MNLQAPQNTSVAECCSYVEVEQIQDVNLEESESLSVLKLENTLDLERTTMMETVFSFNVQRVGIKYLSRVFIEQFAFKIVFNSKIILLLAL